MRILTVINHREDGERDEVTLQASNILMVTSPERLCIRAGLAVRRVYVKFTVPGEGGELYVS